MNVEMPMDAPKAEPKKQKPTLDYKDAKGIIDAIRKMNGMKNVSGR